MWRAAWMVAHIYRACFQAIGGRKGARVARKITPERLLGKKINKKKKSTDLDSGEHES